MKQFRWILMVLLISASIASADTWHVENAEMIADFYSGSNLWLPSAFMLKANTVQIITTIIANLSQGGMILAIALLLCEAARIYLNGGSLQIHESYTFYGKAILVFTFLAMGVASGNLMFLTLKHIFFDPIEAITGIIKSQSNAAVMKQIADALAAAAAANQDSSLSWFKKIFELDMSMLMTNFFMMFALCISWVVSLYVGVMASMVMALSPICLPFFLFQPVSGVAWNWVKSMIAYPMMGVVGSMVTALLMTSGMLKFAVTTGALGQNLTAIASSVILILVMCSVPAFTSALFGGIVGSPMAAARSLTGAAATVAAAGATVAGAALVGSAPVARAAGEMGVRLAGAPTPNEDFRATTARELGGAAKSYSEVARPTGMAILESQFPGFARMARNVKAARKENMAAKEESSGKSTFSSGTPQPSSVATFTPSVVKGPSDMATSTPASYKTSSVAESSLTKPMAAGDLGTQQWNAGTASAPKATKDWKTDIGSWDTPKLHDNMTKFVKGRYGADVAEQFATKLQEPQWSGVGIDTSKYPEGSSYDAIMSPVMFPLLEAMGIKPAVARNLADLDVKDRGKGYNFSMNNREGNRDLMTNYVRDVAGDSEAKLFSQRLDPNKDYLVGRQNQPVLAVANAVEAVYRENGRTPPSKPEGLQAVEQFEMRKAAQANTAAGTSSAEPDRGNYRGKDTFTPATENMKADVYRDLDRSKQIEYLREVARTANNGQYAEWADKVKIPSKFNPMPRGGQSWPEASLGVMKALMERQGFIGSTKNKNKENEG